MKRTLKYYRIMWLKHDLPAGLSVFLVALPLCLGIALASGAPLYAGLLSGIIGGLVVSFISGSLISLFVGFLGMHAATKANIKTTMAAKNHGEHEAFIAAFYGGGVMGFSVATAGLAVLRHVDDC